MRNHVYTLPCKPGSIYINLGAECLNDCRFCVKRFGTFFGYNLETEYSTDMTNKIQKELERVRTNDPKEIVICGIGEPFLHYDDVIKIAKFSTTLFRTKVPIRADTAGLWWEKNRNLSFLDYITSLSISLNAESEEKYEQICQPKIPNAYNVLMDFLKTLSEERKRKDRFPDVRLTIVDTSRKELMPPREKTDYEGDCPVPEIERCREIANDLGFPLVVKQLFRDSHECWNPQEIELETLAGEYMKRCMNCRTRHI